MIEGESPFDVTVPVTDGEGETAERVTVVAFRYRLGALLGKGGNGEVWEADDLLSGMRVAIKLLTDGLGSEPARVRREVSALRMLRLPGVVRLLDEGTDSGRAFLVMELLQGTPFPGTGAPRTWAGIARVTIALLETLARVHVAGVIHRDLKPANVLVSAEGLPTILDFGLSFGTPLGEGLTREGLVLGTPAYLAPEQIVGEAMTPRTDLYALGLMLYQALSGDLPHAASDLPSLLRGRLILRAPPLLQRAPDVPSAVARAVDQLLSRSPEDRPRSAAEVLGMLQGHSIADLVDPPLPRIDGGAPVRALLEYARAGISADLVGPPRSGRSRCLHEVGEALKAEGRTVLWARPGRHPFESLEVALGSLVDQQGKRLREIVTLIEERLSAVLGAGVVLLTDDIDRLDRWSAGVLSRVRLAGVVLRVWSAPPPAEEASPIVSLVPLDEAALRSLFAGRDRIFHIPTDAARVLWLRTEGLQARIEEEVKAWLRAGIARWDGDRLSVDRDTLDRLSAGLRVIAPGQRRDPSGAAGISEALAPHLEELCAWIILAWPSADPELLASMMALPLWRIEADLEELGRRNMIRVLPDGRIEPTAATRVEDGWSSAQRRASHRAIAAALPPGTDGRLLHLMAGEEETEATLGPEFATEAEVFARRLAQGGRLGQAVAVLGDGLLALRRGATAARDPARTAAEERLISTWVEIALSDGTPQAMDRVLYEICRAGPRSQTLAHLEELVRGALAFHTGGARALALLDSVAPFSDLSLERHRQGFRVVVARRCSREMEEMVLQDVEAWAAGTGDPLTLARCAGWLGRLRYRQGRYEEAVRLQARAVESESWVTPQINARLNGASALMEVFRLDDAAAWAAAALQQARECRHAFFEARAEWLLRTIAYRSGAARVPDLELIDAVAHLAVGDVEASICFNEAAVAYRAGDHGVARELAARAQKIWLSIGESLSAFLIRCLALAAGASPSSPDEIDLLANRALRCPVQGIGIQALGLLSRTAAGPRPAWEASAAPLVLDIPEAHRGIRMDILSADEALASIRARRSG